MFKQRPDGTIVDENDVVATPEALQKAGIAVPQANQVTVDAITTNVTQPTVESLQAELLQAKQQSVLLQDKADGFDTLMGDKDFQKYAFDRRQREAGLQPGQDTQQPPVQTQVQPTDYSKQFSEFEDSDGIGRIIEAITTNVKQEMREEFRKHDEATTKRFEPLMNNLADNQQEADFQALVNQAQQGKWSVDPTTIRKEIDFERQRLTGLTMNQAYDLVKSNLERRDLITRQPVIQQQDKSGQNISDTAQGGNPLVQPAAGGATVAASTSGNRLDDAVKERVGPEGAPVRRTTEDIINQAAKQMAEAGNPVDTNSL